MEEEYECKVKYCPGCNKIKSIKDFHKNKSRYDGLKNVCIKCSSLRDKKDSVKNWASILVCSARKRIKTPPCNLTKEFILELYEKQNHKCYWYDIEMLPSLNPCDPQQPTIDRLDQDKGYTQDNVVLSCFAANIGRNITSKERFREFSEMLKGNTNKQ